MRKVISILIVAIIFFNSNGLALAINANVFDDSETKKGAIGVNYASPDNKRTKLLVEKDGEKYSYNLNGEDEKFPLQLGTGEYKISIYENIEGNKYKLIKSEMVTVNLENDTVVYLNSIQNVKWDHTMDPIKKAKELTSNIDNDEEKIKKIYNYIVSNIEYDFAKVDQLSTSYLPNVNQTYTDNKGICYDYASLFAAMLRSVDIPTKLVMGNAANVKEYHAWNEVYIESLDQWVIIDTTVDAQMEKASNEVSMIKDSKLYSKSKEY